MVTIVSNYDHEIEDYRNKCLLHFGGMNGDKIYFGKPVIYDDNNVHYMFPNEARLRNMTYGISIHYDIEVEFIDILRDGEDPTIIDENSDRKTSDLDEADETYVHKKIFSNIKLQSDVLEDDNTEQYEKTGGARKPTKIKRTNRNKKPYQLTTSMTAEMIKATQDSLSQNVQKRTIVIPNVYLGNFPIMVQSKFCILSGVSAQVRETMGECRNDLGGYFIIQGKEKVVVCQEKLSDNMLCIKKHTKQEIIDEVVGMIIIAISYIQLKLEVFQKTFPNQLGYYLCNCFLLATLIQI